MKITHIRHSCFLVELEGKVLLFDWYKGDLPEVAEGKPWYVFVSHSHEDHYSEIIYTLREKVSKVTYIIDSTVGAAQADDVIIVEPHQKLQVDDLCIRTLLSTDEGVAFDIETEGYRIYHAGDLNLWYWEGEPDADNQWQIDTYQAEIGRLEGGFYDAAFVPLDPRLEKHGADAMEGFLHQVPCGAVFPMHYWRRLDEARACIDQERFDPFRDKIHFDDTYVIDAPGRRTRTLFVNACIRGEVMSRSLMLARYFLDECRWWHPEMDVTERHLLTSGIHWLTGEDVDRRTHLLEEGRTDDEMFALAREFARADRIVIAAPFWDYSFPALLKVYIEQICVQGVTFVYTETGSRGLSAFKELIYITSCGGYVGQDNEAVSYMRKIAEFLGCGRFRSVCAEGLDIIGNDVQQLMAEKKAVLREIAGDF